MPNVCKPILLVEDNPDHADLVRDAVAHSEVQTRVIWAHDGEEALDYLYRRGKYEAREASAEPAIVLLDIKLPGMNGLAVLRQIRADPQFDHIPVVMLTTSAQETEVVEAYASRANSYIVKPISFQQFHNRVQDLSIYWTVTNYLPEKCDG